MQCDDVLLLDKKIKLESLINMKTDLPSLNGFMWTRRPTGCEPDSLGHATHFTFKHKKNPTGPDLFWLRIALKDGQIGTANTERRLATYSLIIIKKKLACKV
jgi:hypothetical protein